jgi:hypothetical protein
LVADQILSTHIATGAINAKHILAGSITAGSAIIAEGAIGRGQIALAAIGAAQIDLAVITDAHIDSLNASKITAGKIKAQYVEISSETTFAEGYNPTSIDANIRSDLNIESALPTNITFSNEGIKATTTADPNKYVLINHEGIYVHNGAIIIGGGLTKDNIDPTTTEEWDKGAQFAADMANDNIVTPSEKSVLARDWEAWKAEYSSLLAQADWYWPDNSTAPFAKTDYIQQYGLLREYLTALPDQNNNYPILYGETITKDSYIEGEILNTRIDLYKTASFRLQQELGIAAKKAADDAQQNVDDVENNIVYKVEITSTRGNIFKNGQVDTLLEARAYHGSQDVTDQFPEYKFQWTRVSDDPVGDALWNQNHFSGMKTVVITRDDIYVKATFNCELLE